MYHWIALRTCCWRNLARSSRKIAILVLKRTAPCNQHSGLLASEGEVGLVREVHFEDVNWVIYCLLAVAPRVRIVVASNFPADDPQRSDKNKCKELEERLNSKSRH